MTRRPAVCLIALAAQAALGCDFGQRQASEPEEQLQPWFEEIAARSGVSFVYRSGERGEYQLPAITGGGVAVADVNRDGHLDLYFVQNSTQTDRSAGSCNRLFRNRGDGTFDDVTEASGAGICGYGMGVTAGDYDNDGDIDLYVTNVGRNTLLQNDGQGRFRDVTAAARVGEARWSTSAAFVDYDRDGDLDLYVANYINWLPMSEIPCYTPSGARDYCSPRSYNAPLSDTLYLNDGNGTFTDISAEAGLHAAFGNGLGVSVGDADGNGWVDVYVANDRMPNQLWLNQRNGRFSDEAFTRGVAVDLDGAAKAGMGVHLTDADGDADLDVLVVNLAGESDSFYRNEGAFFTDDTTAVGLRTVSRPFTRFGLALVDFDNDALLDVYEANGRVSRGSGERDGDSYAEPNVLLRGTPDGRLAEVQPRGGTATPLVATSRAAAFGDLDNDGGMDIVVVNRDAPVHVLRNVVRERGHWMMFRVLDEHGRDAIGATVSLSASGRRMVRDVQVAYSYLASNDPRVHFGLGTASRVSDVRVRWVDGRSESFGDFEGGRIVTLRRTAPPRATSRP